jgi:hypothetical protein
MGLRPTQGEITLCRKKISKKGPRNCRSLDCARDDKGEGGASIESGCWTEGVFHTFDIRQAALSVDNPRAGRTRDNRHRGQAEE